METSEEGKRVEKRMSPEYRAALNRYIPITSDPIDRFTPAYLRAQYPQEKWPVIHIRKPGSLDLIAGMEADAALQKDSESQPQAVVGLESPTEGGEAAAPPKIKPSEVAALGREAVKTWRERVLKFENMVAFDGSQLTFQEKGGVITDECLNQIPWQTFLAVHFRYNALFSLTDLEREGLELQPASA